MNSLNRLYNLQKELVDQIAEGMAKDDQMFILTKIQFEKASLEDWNQNKGSISVLMLEQDLDWDQAGIASFDSFIATLTAREAELTM